MFKRLKLIYNSDEFLGDISTIVFFGSLWGIVEATLGYLLHKINFSFGWCIWFPLAFYFMDKIYRKTRKAQYMLYGAFIASAIKLTNLFIEVRVDKVINPSISIVLEAVALLAVYKILEKKNKKVGLIGIGVVNISWRGLYAIYLLLMPRSFLIISPLRGLDRLLRFMLLECIATTLIITSYIVVRERLSKNLTEEKKKGFSTNPIISFSMFVFAIFLERFI
ncbi:hypothetical protein [uncultured Clostridium sp.]|uniref:hypothetical protein n=1 Tax=uncultured Clostridium sp. TaxID=59620 RepID=UPI0028E1946C|nr:hypothetical protein [uncultured Clostridium sp.]